MSETKFMSKVPFRAVGIVSLIMWLFIPLLCYVVYYTEFHGSPSLHNISHILSWAPVVLLPLLTFVNICLFALGLARSQSSGVFPRGFGTFILMSALGFFVSLFFINRWD